MTTHHLNTETTTEITLSQLGWKPFFQQQLTLEDYDNCRFARITAHHRSGYHCLTETGSFHLNAHPRLPELTVGDWILVTHEQQFVRPLERFSKFSRKAAGSQVYEQLICANVDTAFLVCSLNDDFNLSRIERYLAIAKEAQVEPIIVLTKADLCEQATLRTQQVQALDSMLVVESVNALNPADVSKLKPWCRSGQSVVFLGSSGVGKSTLTNTLLESQIQATGGIREDDSKGRHTTTSRSMHLMINGGIIIDTPGMRELQLAECQQGVSSTFADIEELVDQCQFNDCQHTNEPGCAIRQALANGNIEQRRYDNYLKLLREQALNSASLAEKRALFKKQGKMYRNVQSEKRKRQSRY